MLLPPLKVVFLLPNEVLLKFSELDELSSEGRLTLGLFEQILEIKK